MIAELPKGTRLTDYLSLGVLTTRLPLRQVKAVLAAQGKASRRQRELPAHVVVYYVIALALFMQVSYREVLRCLLEGLTWLLGPEQTVKVTGKSGISQARTRLGWKVLRSTVRRGGEAGGGGGHARGLVPELAPGESGRQHAGGSR